MTLLLIILLDYNTNATKKSLNRSGSNIFSRLEKNTKAMMILKNKDDKCFQCAVKVELNHENIKNLLEKISKIKSDCMFLSCHVRVSE